MTEEKSNVDATIDNLLAGKVAGEATKAPAKASAAKKPTNKKAVAPGIVRAKAPAAKKPVVEGSFALTAEEQEELRAIAEQEIHEELKEEQRRAFLESEKIRIRKEKLFQHGKDEEGEDTELVAVILASHSTHIRLDSSIYYHGRAYRVGRGKAQVLKEQMYRGWLHTHELSGENMNAFYGRQASNAIINQNNPNGGLKFAEG